MIFMLSASGMSLSNELSSVLLKVSHLIARLHLYLYVYLYVLSITLCGVEAGVTS